MTPDDNNKSKEAGGRDYARRRWARRRRARKIRNFAVWSALSVATAINAGSAVLEHSKAREELRSHRETVQSIETFTQTVHDQEDRDASWRDLNQEVERLGTFRRLLKNEPVNTAILDSYEKIILRVSSRAVKLGREELARLPKDDPKAEEYRKVVQELEDLILGWDTRKRDKERAEEIYEAAGKLQRAIEKLTAIGALSLNTRPPRRLPPLEGS